MYLLVQLQVSELMLKDILALMSLGVKLNLKKKMPQVTLYSHYVSCGADISVIIDIFTQEGSKCMKNRQFNSQIAHFLWAHSLFTFPFPNFLLQTTGGETYFLVLFFCFVHLSLISSLMNGYLTLPIYLFKCLTRASATALAVPSISLKCFVYLTSLHIHLCDPNTVVCRWACAQPFPGELPVMVPFIA